MIQLRRASAKKGKGKGNGKGNKHNQVSQVTITNDDLIVLGNAIVDGVKGASTYSSDKANDDLSAITDTGNKRAASGSVGDFIAQNRMGKKQKE